VSVDGVPATTSPVNVTVVPGDASPQTSVLTAGRSSLAVGETTELLLEVRDAAGNRVTKGGLTVTFTMAGPTGGTISATTDRGDGTYAALFSATVGGSTVTIGARIDGTPVVATTPIAVTP
jgi:adhesin/invasin